MSNRDGISGVLLSVNAAKKELTLEEHMIAYEAEPATEDKRYSYDLDDDWDEDRLIKAVGEHVYGMLVDGVVKRLYLM